METVLLLGGIAPIASFAAVFSASCAVGKSLATRRVALAAQGERLGLPALAKWRLRNGFAALMPVARRAVRVGAVSRYAEEAVAACAERGVPTSADALASVAIAALAALAAVVTLVFGSPVSGLAVGACAVAVCAAAMGNARDKRKEAVRETVPDALESMSVCFGSGFTLLQTFRQVADDVPGLLGQTFARSAHILETGGSSAAALRELREGAHASELAFVAVALDVQHQSGGGMRQVLDAATDTVKSELALRRALRVQTAQARLSARIVVVMPFILVTAFSLASPDFLSPFFSSVFGYALLAAAVVMQVSGVLLVRRALVVDGVS